MATTDVSELRIGDPAPDFRLPASTGGEIGLGDYRGKSVFVHPTHSEPCGGPERYDPIP